MRAKGVTINTDASFKEGIGAYAFWIKCDHFTLKRSGYFRERVKDPTIAEAQCIANAIAAITDKAENLEFDYVVINTDSKGAISGIKSGSKEIYKFINLLINQLKARVGCKKVSLRHVKAHSGKKDARSWVNDWCDKECKRQRLIAEKIAT